MLEVTTLYRPYQMEKKYTDINEEKILTYLYKFNQGDVDKVISEIINEAVLAHMNLALDSTIMQMLALNDYLSKLFMDNFNKLTYNYCIHYLENKNIRVIKQCMEEKINELSKAVHMKTKLEDLNEVLNKMCDACV